ncbi:helix-turn-helix domain-containing protein [Sorangium sp. So ce296]|uniref:helix-turn-helix domain-containing protein n=1 Tax=Sorangium sp. So ce296 TaxID=3133296 RepID=UPI003F63F3E7
MRSPPASRGRRPACLGRSPRARRAGALRATQGNKSQAAARLGLSRHGLLNKMDRHGLK